MIARSPHGRQVHERAEFFCSDITGLSFSRMPPYAQATILSWNSILFENVTSEFVKREVSEMVRARLFVCTARICPRHREPCFGEFCSSFELFKEADIACSWKAEPQCAYFYRSHQSY
ncbi:S-adenosyl-L-methionine-dependent methyltransferase [Phytophthora cactorum]|nr:S-adenosyl-L-methionine-dependent methyltransferase [Phytophthora cactorum]